MVEKIYGN